MFSQGDCKSIHFDQEVTIERYQANQVAMDSIKTVISRGNALFVRDSSSTLSPTIINLVIALMVLVIIGFIFGGGLYLIRKLRKARVAKNAILPTYNTPNPSRNVANHRRLTITTGQHGGRIPSIYIYDEKSSLTSNSSSPPLSPENVPEIRITFPDEQDELGRPKSGRVVIVRVGEHGVGLEPLRDEQLPAYEKEASERFHSIDMERIGGLKEKLSWS